MLHYSLYDNTFSEDDPDDCLARPVDVTVRTDEDLIKEITGAGSILKPTETEAVINNYWQTIIGYIRQGEAYRDDFIRTRFGISGVFENEEDQFDPSRHEVKINLLPKDSITNAARKVTPRKVDGQETAPKIETIYDWGSGTNDEILTPGDVLEVTGNHLKIRDELKEEGIYFVSQNSNTEAKAVQIRDNEPKKLTLRIPDGLQAGPWRIEVRNTSRNGDELRTGIFNTVLTVE